MALVFVKLQVMTLICRTSFYKFELGNKTTISNLSGQQSNYHPLGTVDDPMTCCPRPFIRSSPALRVRLRATVHQVIHSTEGVIVLTVAQKGTK